jgi:Icc-related predicted phosphoesterase
VIRIAAIGDLHFGTDSAGTIRPHLEHLGDQADLLLIAGDLTRIGDPMEAAALAEELRDLPVPVFAVLGNHDFHSDRQDQVRRRMEGVGVRVLEGEGAMIDVGGSRLGIAGLKGFGGGFAGASGSDFGEPEMKAFVRHTKSLAARLEEVLSGLEADRRVVLMHYSPIEGTLQGERLEIYPFLGSYLLAEAVDREGADLIIHGHAHRGTERGVTPGGILVRNVSQPVIRHAYNVYCLEADEAPFPLRTNGVGARRGASVRIHGEE